MITFVIGLVLGIAAASTVFIVFGKNNKNKIAAARERILRFYEQNGGEELEKALEDLKSFGNKKQ